MAWEPDFTKPDPYADMPPEYEEKVKETFVPTPEHPLNPIEEARLRGEEVGTEYIPPPVPEKPPTLPLVAGAGVGILGLAAIPGVGWGAILALAAGLGLGWIASQLGIPEWVRAKLEQYSAQQLQQAASAHVTAQQHYLTEQQLAQGQQLLQKMLAESASQQTQTIATQDNFTRAFEGAMLFVARAINREELESGLASYAEIFKLDEAQAATLTTLATAVWEERMTAAEACAVRDMAQLIPDVATMDPDVALDMSKIDPALLTGGLSLAGLMALLPTLSRTMARSSHSQGLGCMGTTGATMLSNLAMAALPTALAAGVFFNPKMNEAVTGLASQAVEFIYDPLIEQAPVTPDKAPGIGASLLTQAIMLGSGAHFLSAAAESFAPLKHMGLGYLSAFMCDLGGFSRIAAAYQGMMIQWGLTQPMRYWSLEKFRPMLLEPRDFSQLMSRRAFTEPEVLRVEGLAESQASLPGGGGVETERAMIGYMGYPDSYLPIFKELANTPLRYFPLAGIARSGFFDRPWYEEALARSGYSVTAKEQLIRMYEAQVLESTRGMMSGAVTKPYRLGLLDDAEFNEHMLSLGYQPSQNEKALYAAKLDLATEQAEDSKRLYIDQFKKGLIDDGDLSVAISSLGYRPEVVTIEVQRAITAVTPKVAKEEPPENKALMRSVQSKYVQAYTQLFRKHLIDEDTFYQWLVKLKVDPGLAEATVTLEAYKKLPKLEVETL